MPTRPAYWKETIHNNLRRAPWHDYRGRCIYMITFNKAKECPPFSDVALSTMPEGILSLHQSGLIIANEIIKTPSFHPQVSIIEYVVMPDHVHILIFVKEKISKHIGDIIQAIKSTSTRQIRNIYRNTDLQVFEPGFNDKILFKERRLDTLINYIRANPYRLAVRRANPGFFSRVNQVEIQGTIYSAYGNIQLLSNPFKDQVVVHRADSVEKKKRDKERWTYLASNGGILVSPFISPAEKEIRSECETLGAKFILITPHAFPERYKPVGHDFELCTAGRLLIISLGLAPNTQLSRSICMQMNNLAQNIAEL